MELTFLMTKFIIQPWKLKITITIATLASTGTMGCLMIIHIILCHLYEFWGHISTHLKLVQNILGLDNWGRLKVMHLR